MTHINLVCACPSNNGVQNRLYFPITMPGCAQDLSGSETYGKIEWIRAQNGQFWEICSRKFLIKAFIHAFQY